MKTAIQVAVTMLRPAPRDAAPGLAGRPRSGVSPDARGA